MNNKYFCTKEGFETVKAELKELKSIKEKDENTIRIIKLLEDILENTTIIEEKTFGDRHQLSIDNYISIYLRLETLRNVDRPRVIEALKEARLQGDLSENAEYDAARDEQTHIETEIKNQEKDLKNAVIIKDELLDNMGKIITVLFVDTNEQRSYSLVNSSLDIEPLAEIKKISKNSPLGKKLAKCKKGDVESVKPDNGAVFNIKIINIETDKKKK